MDEVAASVPGSLGWDEVQGAAKEIFNVWGGNPELRWAERAWDVLATAGLTRYTGQADRLRVYIRFLALGAIYRDFCYLAFDEYTEPEYGDWICDPPYDEVGILEFRLGQIVGEAAESDEEYVERSTLIANVVPGLIGEERGTVAQGLVKGFGNISSLFVSLWRSKDELADPARSPRSAQGGDDLEVAPSPQLELFSTFESDEYSEAVPLDADLEAEYGPEDDDDYDEDDGYETDDEILNDVDELKLRAFGWLDEGCPSVF